VAVPPEDAQVKLPINEVVCGDNLDVMASWPGCCVDAVVTDPPYGIEFMGKDWDHGVPGEQFWAEFLRIAKPGAHLVAFGGTRTFHRLTCAIEDAGWEIRDCLMWLYGSGFPKSLNVGKGIDRAAGELKPEGTAFNVAGVYNDKMQTTSPSQGYVSPSPVTDAAKQWYGWGTALKPAWEPIIMARKPLIGTVAANVLAHGTGALNVDGCRVKTGDDLSGGTFGGTRDADGNLPNAIGSGDKGRWPANVLLDPEAAAMLDEQSGERPSRFFYTSKASRADRGPHNDHPTVKPTALMRWLVRLVCPAGGIVLDPFNGSGATTYAAREEDCRYIGIDQDGGYCETARRRLAQGVLEFA